MSDSTPASLESNGAAVPAAAVVPLTAPPLPARVALADLIALGKVTAVEDDADQLLGPFVLAELAGAVAVRAAGFAGEAPGMIDQTVRVLRR